ncbi:MAG: SpoIIE family protein phosphatase [Ignavibacteriae bacterium]|nr:SpoIIE family protein phosphatase [Ignavibacteriota bacterium]
MSAADPVPPDHALIDENRRLRKAIEELSVINELARAISVSLDPHEIMQTIIRRSLRALQAEQGVITLVEQQSADPMKTLVRSMASSSEREEFHLTQALLGWMHLNKKPLLINSPKTDERFRGVTWDESITSLLCVPMMLKSELKGVITIYNKKGREGFTEDEQRLLAIIAAQSAQVVENARLHERERQLIHMQEEVRLASKIQNDLLPKSAPAIDGYEIAGRSIPAQVVGGDYFDFIPINELRLAICLGDVSGKGLPASLLMANTQATLRGQTLINPTARECMERSNKLLFDSTGPEKFVTMFFSILDVSSHQLNYCNAGHDIPYLLSNSGALMRLNVGGIPLSMMEQFPFEEETIAMQPGDLLVICSDGIAEAMNVNQEQFGEERLSILLDKLRASSAVDVIDGIVSAVRAHAGAAPQADDMTVVVVRRKAH